MTARGRVGAGLGLSDRATLDGLLLKEIRQVMHASKAASTTALARLPVLRITSAVEASDYDDPMLLHFEEDSVGKAPHASTLPSPVEKLELPWVC